MKLQVFDTETTGIPEWKLPSDHKLQPHIVSLAGITVDSVTMQVENVIDCIVKPEGWTIPQDTIDIHGITNEKAMDVGIPEKQLLEMFIEEWSKCGIRIAHNSTFDNRIIRIGTKRYMDEESMDNWKAGIYKCTGILSKNIMQMLPRNKYGYKMPKLIEAYPFFTGKELINAHSALADATACMEVYFVIQELMERLTIKDVKEFQDMLAEELQGIIVDMRKEKSCVA